MSPGMDGDVVGTGKVLGVDACRAGWVAIVLRDGRVSGAEVDASLRALLERHLDAAAVGVDMPIGLPAAGTRPCDEAARSFVGARRSSVFATPPAEVLAADSHAEATRLSARLSGTGISQQSYALRAKIREVEAVAADDPRVIEVHPEVSFAALAGGELRWPKKTWAGQQLRQGLLAAAGIELPADLGPASAVAPDDVLDAAAAAWSAQRYALGEAQSLPPDASPGERKVIWY